MTPHQRDENRDSSTAVKYASSGDDEVRGDVMSESSVVDDDGLNRPSKKREKVVIE